METSFEPDPSLPETALSETTQPKQLVGEMLLPFGVYNFRLLFAGQTVSTLGDALYAVALPWLVLSNGGNAQELGIVLTAYGIPRVGCVLLGGLLSDRLRPRRMMLTADIARALLVGILATVALWGHPTIEILCAIAAPLGAFQGLFLPSSSAILPELVSDEALQAANALNFASTQAATLLGSAIAGVIVSVWSSGTAMIVDSLSFVVSAISLALMRANLPSTRSTREEAGNTENLGSTLSQEEHMNFGRFMRTSRLIQVALVVSIAANFCFGGLLEIALPTLVHGSMHGGANGYGLIMAAFGAGALLGGLIAGSLNGLKKKGVFALFCMIAMSIFIAVVPFGGIPGAALCMLLSGLVNSISNILLITVIQRAIPHHMMGRVMGVLLFATFGTYPISVALGGILTNQFGPMILFPFSGGILLLVTLFGFTQKAVREL